MLGDVQMESRVETGIHNECIKEQPFDELARKLLLRRLAGLTPILFMQ